MSKSGSSLKSEKQNHNQSQISLGILEDTPCCERASRRDRSSLACLNHSRLEMSTVFYLDFCYFNHSLTLTLERIKEKKHTGKNSQFQRSYRLRMTDKKMKRDVSVICELFHWPCEGHVLHVAQLASINFDSMNIRKDILGFSTNIQIFWGNIQKFPRLLWNIKIFRELWAF